MAKHVTYLGKPGRPDSVLVIDGMNAWVPGEPRLFDDTYAQRYGFENGDDFAEFFVTVYNGGQKEALFSSEDAPLDEPGENSPQGSEELPQEK